MNGPVLTVETLIVRTAAGNTLLRDLGFSLSRGEIIGIAGEDGSGNMRLGATDLLRPGAGRRTGAGASP
ncbi:hypothetical protein [Roseovarius sp. SYSU LYC5161]|uniref:hypothetical protein n=1 Tax=Roseovarius halophilus (ex Wu et al. 2025) TaxID=3376060 RepID=UPI0028714A1B|nr:hypothetical protein [Roseovarius sp.]